MNHPENHLFATNYFQNPWTWVRRAFVALTLCLGVILLYDIPLYAQSPLILLILLYWLAKPKEDILLSHKELVILKRSRIKAFTKRETFELSNISSFRVQGVHNSKWEMVDFFNGGNNMGGAHNLIEISFKDGGSHSLTVKVSRKELDTIRKMIYQLKAKMDNPTLINPKL